METLSADPDKVSGSKEKPASPQNLSNVPRKLLKSKYEGGDRCASETLPRLFAAG